MTKLTNLQNEAQKITLSAQEKAVMRAQIFGDERVTNAPVKSYTVSHFQFFSVRFIPAMAAVLVVVLGTGTTYAAQAALPGDLLYTIKVGVNEPVRSALAVSSEAKVAFHAEVAETRLEEAEALAAEGRLSASTSEQIEESLEIHLARAEEIKSEIEEEDLEESVEIAAALDSVLEAHSSILATLGEESDDEETRERSSHLASRLAYRMSARTTSAMATTMSLKVAVPESADAMLIITEDASTSARREGSATMTMQASEELSTSSNPSGEANKRAAEQLKEKATETLEEAQERFDDMEGSLDATTTARVKVQFDTLNTQLQDGRNMYEAEEYIAARATFSAVLSDASALGAYLRAEKRFSRNFLRSWVDDRFGRIGETEVEVEAESEVEIEHESEIKGDSIEHEDDEDAVSDGKDGADGKDGKDGTNGSSTTSSSSIKIKADLGL